MSIRFQVISWGAFALLFASCGGGASAADDAGADGGADGGDGDVDTDSETEGECVDDGVWVDPFDEAACPDMSGWEDCAVHVRADAAPGGDGQTWATAFSDVQRAVNTARCGVVGTDLCAEWQVWVAEGTYYVYDQCREDTIRLRSDVALYGGFAGDETALEERDPQAHETILSAADGPELAHRSYYVTFATEIQGATLDGFTLRDGRCGVDNGRSGCAMRAVHSEVTVANCLITGNEAGPVFGIAGIYAREGATIAVTGSEFSNNVAIGSTAFGIDASEAVVANCVFSENVTTKAIYAGAVSLAASSTAQFVDCAFSENTGGMGAAMMVYQSSGELVGCDFEGNTSPSGSGAMQAHFSEVSISDCSFTANTGFQGGAASVHNGSVSIHDSLFEGNEGRLLGGGLYVADGIGVEISGTPFRENSVTSTGWGGGAFIGADTIGITACRFEENTGGGLLVGPSELATIESSVFDGNTESVGAAIRIGGGSTSIAGVTIANNAAEAAGAIYIDSGALEIASSILWDNAPYELSWADLDNPPTVTTSVVTGGFAGDGNLDADPLFVDAAGGDFHLQAGSPCIDAADGDAAPELDFDGFSRWDDPATANTGIGDPAYADIGAYEWQGE